MTLPLPLALLLVAAGVWNLVIWPQFARRILADPRSRDDAGRRTRFLTVHLVLIGVSLVLGVGAGVVGVVALL